MMKKILFVIMIVIPYCIFATPQISDNFIYNGEEYSLYNLLLYESPLQVFYSSSNFKNPFKMTSTANYRGFIATWEVDDSKLFLTKIEIPGYNVDGRFNLQVPLKEIFFQHVTSNRVHAIWFNGIIKCSSPDESIYFHIENGQVVRFLSQEDNSDIKSTNEEFKSYIKKQPHYEAPDIPVLDESQILAARAYIKQIHDSIHEEYKKQKEAEEEADRKTAFSLYSKLPGYYQALNDYRILDSQVGYFYPQGKTVSVALIQNNNLQIKFWWNITTDDYKTSDTTWYHFIEVAKNCMILINKQEWLLKWLEEIPERHLQVRIYGDKGYFLSDSELEDFLDGVWYHAKFNGTPYCNISLYNEAEDWIGSLYLGFDDIHGIIDYLGTPVQVKYEPEKFIKEIVETGKHWLSVISLFFHKTQEVPEYLVVDPSGNWYLNQDARKKEIQE